jgi:ketosteroid isomerase-like protein
MKTACLLCLIALSFASGCAHNGERSPREVNRLMQTSRDWAAAAATGDLERALSYWAEDAVLMPPDGAALVGKAAIRTYLAQTANIPGFSITWTPEMAVVAASGDVGYMVERNRVTFKDSGGVLRTQYGKAVTVWRKDASGAWKNVVDTWNANPTEHVLPSNKSR